MTMIPVLRNKYLKAWPKHEQGEAVEYLELELALDREYPEDAHFGCYSVPNRLRRLDTTALKQIDVPMVVAVFDVDGPEHVCTPEWWEGECIKIDALLAVHSLFIYRTTGGYRIVGTLREPIAASTWSPIYRSWVRYLARRFSIKADAVADWPRLFRLPHAKRDGVIQRLETRGEPGLWDPELLPEDSVQLTVKENKLLKVRLQDAPNLLHELFRARGWLGETQAGGGINVRCPRYHEHSNGAPEAWDPRDSSTTILPATEDWRHGYLKCLHTNCGHDQLKPRDWLAHFSPQEILAATENLTSTWWAGLLLNGQGVMPVGANVAHVLRQNEAWMGRLAFDEFANEIQLDGRPLANEDLTTISHWCAKAVGFEPGPERTQASVALVARESSYNPVKEYLEGLIWDGEERLPWFLAAYFSAEQSDWSRAAGLRWMISAVARIFEPGCQADHMLVLESQHQGVRKSTGLEALVPNRKWFGDSALPIGEKDAYVALQHKWIYEIGELNSFKGRDVTWIKSFISARSDHYRPPFERLAGDYPRQIVFAGTTNEAEYLEDRTGNRRFWPVRCNGLVQIASIRKDRDQLWAEAVMRYRAGESWYLDTPELVKLAVDEQEARTVTDDWTVIIAAWLETESSWVDGKLVTSPRDTIKGVTTGQVLTEALGFKWDKVHKGATMRAAQCLRDLGYIRARTRQGGDRAWRFFKKTNNITAVSHLFR